VGAGGWGPSACAGGGEGAGGWGAQARGGGGGAGAGSGRREPGGAGGGGPSGSGAGAAGGWGSGGAGGGAGAGRDAGAGAGGWGSGGAGGGGSSGAGTGRDAGGSAGGWGPGGAGGGGPSVRARATWTTVRAGRLGWRIPGWLGRSEAGSEGPKRLRKRAKTMLRKGARRVFEVAGDSLRIRESTMQPCCGRQVGSDDMDFLQLIKLVVMRLHWRAAARAGWRRGDLGHSEVKWFIQVEKQNITICLFPDHGIK
jgi:hypothetical protein